MLLRQPLLLSLIVTAFFTDRFLKWYAQSLPEGAIFSFLPGLEFGRYLNPALFFFPAWSWIPWAALAVLITIGIIFINSKRQTTNYKEIPSAKPQILNGLKFRILNLFGIWDLGFGIWCRRGLTLVFLGGLSNVFDRFVYGGVIDYVNILGLATINLADILILLGVFSIFWQSSMIKKSVPYSTRNHEV
ncbi:signal peptidase II [Candidatus Uhrbacteria bacterium]|nr:signal peptidase II [Candidatus Uhrbacteria bacterium]